MLADLTEHWRVVYADLRQGFGVWDQVNLGGPDLELVTLAALEAFGFHPAGEAFLAHCSLTRLEADEWMIAALRGD